MKPLFRHKIKEWETKLKGAMERDGFTEVWDNDVYRVLVKRDIPCPAFIDNNQTPVKYAWLSIKRFDQEPVKDWRDMQWIKNQLCGEECEGVELYPAESRLVDSANQFHLWVFEKSFRFPFGMEHRVVSTVSVMGAKQRPFPKDRVPEDAKEFDKILQQINQQKQNEE